MWRRLSCLGFCKLSGFWCLISAIYSLNKKMKKVTWCICVNWCWSLPMNAKTVFKKKKCSTFSACCSLFKNAFSLPDFLLLRSPSLCDSGTCIVHLRSAACHGCWESLLFPAVNPLPSVILPFLFTRYDHTHTDLKTYMHIWLHVKWFKHYAAEMLQRCKNGYIEDFWIKRPREPTETCCFRDGCS